MTRLVGEEQREAEVFINNATIYADDARESLVYDLTLQAGQMPDAQMSSVSLFVDSGGGAAASGVQVCSATAVCKTVYNVNEFNAVWNISDPNQRYFLADLDSRLFNSEYYWPDCFGELCGVVW